MVDLRWRALLGVALILVGRGLQADDSPAKPDLTGYRTVKDAATRAIVPPRAGLAGRTGYLGVSLLKDGQGRLVVEEVQPDSPAAKVGVEKGDILAEVDGETIKTPERFRESLQMKYPGEAVKLALLRRGQSVDCVATLGSTSRPRPANVQRSYLGIVLGEGEGRQKIRIDQVAASLPQLPPGSSRAIGSCRSRGSTSTAAKMGEILLEKKPGDEFEVSVHRGGEDIVLRPKLVADQGGPRPGAGGGAGAAAGRPPGPGGGPGGGQGRGQGGPMTIPLWTKPEFRVAVIGIEFPDIKHNAKVSVSEWEESLLGEGTYHEKKKARPERPRQPQRLLPRAVGRRIQAQGQGLRLDRGEQEAGGLHPRQRDDQYHGGPGRGPRKSRRPRRQRGLH